MSFQFDGVATASPYFFEVELIDGDQAGTTLRNANWYLVRERKRARIRKLYFGFRQLNTADTQTLLQALAKSEFTVQYPDPYDGALKTINVYVGNRKATLESYVSSVAKWGEIIFNCTEY